jgi:hypothetical protein
LRRPTLACVLLLALAGLSTTTAVGGTRSTTRMATSSRALAFYRDQIHALRTETWYWQDVMGVRRSHVRVRARPAASVTHLRHVAVLWRKHAKRASRRAHHPPQLAAWMCIHSYEGSWTDSGAPYYGGLQMDLSFQRSYGAWLLRRKGTADHWTPLEQIWTAVKARRTRGFYPWSNTARSCGLF